jgi:hypothetical protein
MPGHGAPGKSHGVALEDEVDPEHPIADPGTCQQDVYTVCWEETE